MADLRERCQRSIPWQIKGREVKDFRQDFSSDFLLFRRIFFAPKIIPDDTLLFVPWRFLTFLLIVFMFYFRQIKGSELMGQCHEVIQAFYSGGGGGITI